MKKFISVLTTVVMLVSMLCMLAVSAADVTVTGEGWENASYANSVLTNNTYNYSFKVTLAEKTHTASIEKQETVSAEKVYFPKSIIINGVEYACTTIGTSVLGSTSEAANTTTTEIVIPEGYITLNAGSFAGMKALKQVNLPGTVSTIGNNSFTNCTAMTSANFGEGVKQLNQGVFKGCSSLEKVNYKDGKNDLSSITNAVASNASFQDCTSLKGEIVLGLSVLQASLFRSDSISKYVPITKVVFVNNVTKIEGSVFKNCKELKELVFEKNTAAPTTTNTVFTNVPALKVYYPTESNGFTIANIPAGTTYAPIGGKITAITSDSNTVVTYTAANVTGGEAEAIIAVYDASGILLGTKKVALTDVPANAEFDVTGAATAKIFIWESLNTAKPVYNAYEFKNR